MTATSLWWITLAAGVLVIAIVAALLAAIIASAGRIRTTLVEIWTVGQAVANNTAHLDVLRRMNFAADATLASTRAAAEQVRDIGRHRSGP